MNGAAARLEWAFNHYLDIPKEAVIKTDLLRLGVRMEAECEVDWFGVDNAEFWLEGGIYQLRPTIVKANAPSPATPYAITVRDGVPTLQCEDLPIAAITFVPEPRFASRCFSDGSAYADYAMAALGGHELFLMIYPHCQNWDCGEQCAFCDLGVASCTDVPDPERMAEVAAAAFLEPEQMPARPVSLMLTGGAIRRPVRELDEAAFFGAYVQAIKRRLGNRWPCSLAIRALDEASQRRLFESGADVVSMNLEVWDETIFDQLCPGKRQSIGYREWVDRLLCAVDIFGEGNVHCTFVSGVEMAQPFGFDDMSTALDSTLSGFRYLMEHGVIPKMAVWYVAPRSALAHCQPPELGFLLEISKGWYNIWRESHLPPPRGLGPMGPGRAVWTTSAFLDMGG